jgi:hypothetical protein
MAKQLPLQKNLCSELVSVFRLGHHRIEPILGNLEEIGERSAAILTEAPVNTGSPVCIVCKCNILRGVVETCQFDRILGYWIKIRLAPAVRWSRDWFVPDHLLTLQNPVENPAVPS